ncbi:protein phosphatase 2C family protein [Candidatus Parcubacteria bacterium]|nr:protein phosphatase 2C family protein [Candidatus Parcubacteria bacterium]
MKIKRIEAIYDRGTAKHIEDGFVVNPPFFGVFDGVSSPYGPNNPIGPFDGEAIVKTITEIFNSACSKELLEGVLLRANNRVADKQREYKNPLNRADKLAGACFAVAKINKKHIDIIQAGDCFALCVTKNGNINITKNQVYQHETEMNNIVNRLLKKIAKEKGIDSKKATEKEKEEIRGEMWNRFYFKLCKARQQDVNNPKSRRGYGILNGQEASSQMWKQMSLPRSEIKLLLLFSDGIIPWEIMKNSNELVLAEKIYYLHLNGGLQKILNEARKTEKAAKELNYMDFAEATAIAIEF